MNETILLSDDENSSINDSKNCPMFVSNGVAVSGLPCTH